MALLQRVQREERLDDPVHQPDVLRTSLGHVAAVNRWLGGSRALRLALGDRLRPGARVLDVGTGSADLPRDLLRHSARSGLGLTVVAVDRHLQMLRIAAEPPLQRSASRATTRAPGQGLQLAAADALALPFAADAFDAALLSLVLHHLDDGQAVLALREAARVAPVVIVNELHRTVANYLGARTLALTVWVGNPLTRHDGPLSVLRSYRPNELAELAAAAGLAVVELRRRWFQRLVLVATRRAAAAAQNVPRPGP